MENSLIYFLVSLEVAIVPMLFFSIYNPMKKKEEGLRNKELRLDKIKKHMLNNLLRELKPFMLAMFSVMVVSIIFTILHSVPSMRVISGGIIFMLFIFFTMFSVVFFTEYMRTYRGKERIYDSKNINGILSTLNIKKKYHKKIEKFIDSTWDSKEKDNWLLSWFLDSLFYPEDIIMNKK